MKTMSLKIMLVLAIVSLASSAYALFAGEVRGTVTDSTGNPIAGAKITTSANSSALTLSNGVFAMIHPAGSYTITASAEGYQTSTNYMDVTVTELGITTLNFVMFPINSGVSKAIIVVGGDSSLKNPLWNAKRTCANYAYRSLIYQGYTKDRIYYLSPDTNQDVDGDGISDVRGYDSNQNLRNAVTEWAKDANDLIIYMIGHGSTGKFLLNSTEILNASELNSWIDQIKQTIPGKIVFIYDTAKSGSFIPYLAGKDRIIITSSASDENAWFLNDGILSFSYQFWANILNTGSLYDSFVIAKNIMNNTQSAQIDANGNGIANEKEDASLSQIIIGQGIKVAGDIPLIGNIFSEQVIGKEITSVLIYAENVIDNDGIDKVWAEISSPDSSESTVNLNLSPIGNNRYESVYNKFDKAGVYTVSIYAQDVNGMISFPKMTTITKKTNRKAIIVAGGGPYSTNGLWNATKRCTIYAFHALTWQGYSKENIYYLSAENIDADGDGINDVNADATYDNLFDAIHEWAKDAADLILYMVDHGGDGTFMINGTKNPYQIVRADELDLWLDNLQMTMPGKLIVVYDACQSGSFLSMLKSPAGKERIVIASASSDQRAWQQVDGVISFSYPFWTCMISNAYLYQSFITAQKVLLKEQTPQIDVNGNGIANEKEDQRLAENIIIGVGLVASPAPPPIIGTVSGDQFLDGGRDASFEAKNISSLNKIKRVWAVIIPPDYNLASANQPVSELPVVEMTDEDNDGVYRGHYSNFTQTGTYKLNIYASDDQDSYSVPQQTSVTQTKGNSCISVSGNLVLNLCVEYQGATYACTLNPQNISELTWNLDISTLRPIQSDNCIGIGDDLKLDMCAEYLGHTYGFTMNYDRELIWKMDVGTFKGID